jgi:hypothetical protein
MISCLEVLTEFNSRYEEQVHKLKVIQRGIYFVQRVWWLENEAKKIIIKSEEKFLINLKEQKMKAVQETITKLTKEIQDENQELIKEERRRLYNMFLYV